MGTYSRFEIFLDCLWGLALLVALHFLPFSFFKASDLMSMLRSPAMVFQVAILATFAYIFWLRLHRNFLLYQHSRTERKAPKNLTEFVDE